MFGGVVHEGQKYCNTQCVQYAEFKVVRGEMPDFIVEETAMTVHAGACPVCGNAGPIDFHASHFVWSAILFTRSSSKSTLSCRGCARKRQALSALGSGLVGWWGIPFGIIMTPVQIVRNIAEMAGGPDSRTPSRKLHEFVRDEMAIHTMREARQPSGSMAKQMEAMDEKFEQAMDEEENR
jgi:hypothetical protein